MILTPQEAERILTKVFADEIGVGQVSIETTTIQGLQPDNVIRRLMNQFDRFQNKIFFIKLYREMVPGCGLADAKHKVEEISQSLT